jgi:hypothetical protein
LCKWPGKTVQASGPVARSAVNEGDRAKLV